MPLMKPELGALVSALGQHLQISIFPSGKGQWPEGKLSATRKLDIKRPGYHGLSGWILSASPYLVCLYQHRVIRYLWWGSGEMWLCKINLKEDTTRFRLVQALSESNSPTSGIAVLCYEKIGCPRWVVGCYLYRLETHLIDMANF
jgi:hypothetical protein